MLIIAGKTRAIVWLMACVMLLESVAMNAQQKILKCENSKMLKCGSAEFGVQANPFGYSGYYTDSESGMCYLKARYYSPELSTFITRDTYDLSNRYAYCDGNPVNSTDCSGHSSSSLSDAANVAAMLVPNPVLALGMMAAANSLNKSNNSRNGGNGQDGNESSQMPLWGWIIAGVELAAAIGGLGYFLYKKCRKPSVSLVRQEEDSAAVIHQPEPAAPAPAKVYNPQFMPPENFKGTSCCHLAQCPVKDRVLAWKFRECRFIQLEICRCQDASMVKTLKQELEARKTDLRDYGEIVLHQSSVIDDLIIDLERTLCLLGYPYNYLGYPHSYSGLVK